MAKLAPFELTRHDTTAGINYCEKFTPKVDRNGVFSVELPDHLLPIHISLGEKEKSATGFKRHGTAATSNTLDSLKADLRACLDEYHKSEISEEAVILYRFTRDAHYVISDDGRVFPEGNAADAAGYPYGKRSQWAPDLPGARTFSTDTVSAYSVGFAAKVYLKRTFKRATATTVDYERWEGEGAQGKRLNSFARVWMTESTRSPHDRPKPGVLEMPYTEEAAKFFADNMHKQRGLGHPGLFQPFLR